MLRSRYTERSIAGQQQYEAQQRQQQTKQHKQTNKQTSANTDDTLGIIKVYAPDVLNELCTPEPLRQDETKECVIDSAFITPFQSARSPHRSAKKAGHGRTASMIDLLWQEVQLASANNTRMVREAVDRNDRANQLRIRRDYDTIQRGNATFIDAGRAYLALNEEQQRERRAVVYEHWTKHVFIPIQQQVNQHVDANHKQLHRFRQALFEHYLHQPGSTVAFPSTNQHQPGSAPVAPPDAPTTFAYRTSQIDSNDPTFQTLRLQNPRYTSKHSLPVSDHVDRATFTATMWSKLEATPYGRYSKEPADLSTSQLEQIELGVRARMAQMGFDHYEDNQEQTHESKGKRIVRPMKSTAHNIINNLD